MTHNNFFRNLKLLPKVAWSVYSGARKADGSVYGSKGKKTGECHSRMVIVDTVLCVSSSGVRYVQKHGQKQVCAWINGVGLGDVPTPPGRLFRLAFNPYISDRFVALDDDGTVVREMSHGDSVSAVVLTPNGAFVVL